jgi:hypothetical protein
MKTAKAEVEFLKFSEKMKNSKSVMKIFISSIIEKHKLKKVPCKKFYFFRNIKFFLNPSFSTFMKNSEK